MKIVKKAIVGTTESSDVQITISPNEGNGIDIHLKSIVMAQFGESIENTVCSLLAGYGVEDASVEIVDKGAFDWVIKSRVQSALFRACNQTFNWKEAE